MLHVLRAYWHYLRLRRRFSRDELVQLVGHLS